MLRLTLRDLRQLCIRYVPRASRHDNSLNLNTDVSWWYAHELGHVLTVKHHAIGLPMFGLDDDADPDMLNVRARRSYELAAMSVSQRLLKACGRSDLAKMEAMDTDEDTFYFQDRGLVRKILRASGCLRLPRTRENLEDKIKRCVERPGHG